MCIAVSLRVDFRCASGPFEAPTVQFLCTRWRCRRMTKAGGENAAVSTTGRRRSVAHGPVVTRKRASPATVAFDPCRRRGIERRARGARPPEKSEERIDVDRTLLRIDSGDETFEAVPAGGEKRRYGNAKS